MHTMHTNSHRALATRLVVISEGGKPGLGGSSPYQPYLRTYFRPLYDEIEGKLTRSGLLGASSATSLSRGHFSGPGLVITAARFVFGCDT